eukprot:TRINITY_DN51_c0_g1_i2.p1 TRINITY_DN51_c0_g1~~TRINITY_DN51_c0_g1_i2.p1  ORF type:complete len:272 (-),score=63.44 TRINITY_DN51_c0_g1_i2:49-864(-)
MAIGKGTKKGKKINQNKKKLVDPFIRKEWYNIKAPNSFTVRKIGRTFVSKTSGKNIASENLKGRIIDVSLADLNNNEHQAFRIIKLRVDDVQGKDCITNFHGMDFTTDKIRSLVRKWQTLIETNVEVRTTDGYTLRLFAVGFTKRRPNHIKKTCYCKSSQARLIRKKMNDIIVREASTCDIKGLFEKFVPETIGRQIEKECHGIYPIQNVYLFKAKVIKRPKTDLTKLADLHSGGDTREDVGEAIANAYDEKDKDAEGESTLVSEPATEEK